MTELIPECMIPADGGPCLAFAILQEKVEHQASESDRLAIEYAQSELAREKLRAEIARLRAALQRVDGINDNPAHYNPEIDAVVREALRDEQSANEGK